MTQGELEKLAQPFADHMSALEQRIMEDIVRRIKANGFSTASADWQISRLKQLGESEKNIKKWIKETVKASDEEMEKIFSDTVYEEYYKHQRAYKSAGVVQIPFEENANLQQLIKGIRDQTAGEFRNMTASLGFARAGPDGKILYDPLQEFYRDTLDAAMMDIHLGAFDYNTVLSKTINMMTKSGLRWIDYESGHRDRVDVAARRAIVTGFRQIQGKINEQVASQLHTDMFEVTWHAGARPTHQSWQGRVWSMKQLREICGLGDVAGLHGANCYHDYNAFPPGSIRTYTDEQLDEMNRRENTPKKYGGREYTTYEALQKQRAMERGMRKTRQDINLLKNGSADQNQITLKKVKYQSQMQSYKDFSKKMELPEQWSRVYQDGLSGKFLPTKKDAERIAGKSKDDIIKIRKVDIEKNTTKLKAAMKDEDYTEYLKKLDNHQNEALKKLYVGYADGITDIKLSAGGYYSPGGNNIVFSYPEKRYIDNGKDKYSTLAHEYGHYFDAKCIFDGINFNEIDLIHQNTVYGKQLFKKCASSSDEFLESVRKDRDFLKSKLTIDLKNDLARHDSSDGVQDAVDGLLGQRIWWGHGDKYYNRRYSSVKSMGDQKGLKAAYQKLGINAGSQAKVQGECRVYESASEMWANIMAAEVNGGEALEYVKEYLPNSYQAFIKILKGVK